MLCDVLEGVLPHVPRMDLPFDGDCARANGLDLPVVVINLPHRTDRWQTLSRRMSAAGLTKVIRAPAVGGGTAGQSNRRAVEIAGQRHRCSSAQPPDAYATGDRLLSVAPRHLAMGARYEPAEDSCF